MHPPAPIRRWDTDAVVPAQRLDYWVGAVCEGFLEMDVSSTMARGFGAELVSAPLGGIQLNRVRGSAQDVFRTQRAVTRSARDYYYLLCKSDSAWAVAQRDHRSRLLPGDLVLVDSRYRYEFHFTQSCDTMSLQLPTDWVERWLVDPRAHLGCRIDGSGGFGQALSVYARQLQPELALAPPLPEALLGDQLGALLALATGGGDAPRRGEGAGLRERVQSALRERHAEPGLTAAAVARGLGVGERSLHRCLAGSGTSFARQLADCRVEAARHLLADPRFDRLTVAEIGRRVGLLDPSHFVRVVRRHTGATPGALRLRR